MGLSLSKDHAVVDPRFTYFLSLRMIILTLVVGAGIMIAQLSVTSFVTAPLYVLLLTSCIVGVAAFVALRLGVSPAAVIWSIMIVDLVLETAIIHYSGGAGSGFSLVYCLSILGGAFLLQVLGGSVVALLASLAYVGYGVVQSNGWIVPPMADSQLVVRSPEFLQTYMHVSLFFLVGVVGGYLAERFRTRVYQLQSVQTKLRELKVDTDNILKYMSSGVLVVDAHGCIVTVNPKAEEILGVDREEVDSMHVTDVFDPMMPELSGELLTSLSSGEPKMRHEIVVKQPGCRDLPLGISISPLWGDDRRQRGVIAIFQDLTEVRDMQERIRKADRLAAIGELSAGIAHELRNPLASISGSIEMLYHELNVKGENKRLMELIMRESDRLDRIITDFLEFARMRPPTHEAVHLDDCIDDVIVLLRNNPVAAEVAIDVTHELPTLTATFDEEQMKQVFLNLAVNACEAMGDGGRLTISTGRYEDGMVWVAFRDHGSGIDEDALTRLFEPFFTTKDGGTGLGLAIAHKIVEAHGGRIEALNCRSGGAEFRVVCPGSVESREPSLVI